MNEDISKHPAELELIKQTEQAHQVNKSLSAPQGFLPSVPSSASPQKIPTVGANVQDQTVADSTVAV